MGDQDRELLKWVAEELLGLKPGKYAAPDYLLWHDKSGRGYFESDLQSWHGIGVVVEEMERRGWRLLKLGKDPDGDWWTIFKKGDFARYGQGEKPWFAVCEAARKAVEGKEEPPNACPGHP